MSHALIRDTVVVSGSRYIMLGFGMIRNLYMAYLLGTGAYGYWVLFLLVLQYADQAQFGLRLAGDVEIPVLRGRGDDTAAQRTAEVILAAVLVLAMIILLLTAGAGLFALTHDGAIGSYDPVILGRGLLAVAIIILTDQLGRFHLMILRTRKEFVALTAAETLAEVGRTTVVLALGWFMGLTGGLLAYILASAGMAGWLHVKAHGGFRPVWDAPRMRSLFAVGFPLFLSNLANLVIISLDRVVGGITLRGEDFSLYGFATTITLLPVFASYGLRDVLFPTFGERFGGGGSAKAMYPLYSRALYAVAFATPLFVGAVLYGGEFVIRLLLPTYSPSIAMMETLSCGITFMSVASLPVGVLMITGRAWMAFGLEVLAIAVAGAVYAALPASIPATHALAAATCVLYGAYGAGTLVVTLRHCGLQAAEIMRESAFILLPGIAAIVIIFGVHDLLPAGNDAVRSTWMAPLRAVIFAAAFGLVLAFTRGKSDLLATLRTVMQARTV